MNRKTYTLLTALVGLSLMVSGCVAVIAVGAGAGGYAWASGKLSFTTSHGINKCHDATISALGDLGITVTEDNTDTLSGKIKATTATGESVAVDLEPQGPNITKIDVRVGFWGNRTQSTRVADTIQGYLR